ncbi:MAG TPA: Wzz/FepE/Etk N-terminal domain-containing protein, partial [Kutzneria sp.]|nr:Wzz/FepE/Etk N-terminal domain-containing protein [Kutzneria sp.]
MNIVQFLRIIWARRILVILAFVASVAGAYVVAILVQPRYEAVARVNIDLLRKDPVSGLNQDIRNAGIYFDAQQQLIKDYSVTGPVVDRLGWLTDPN